MEIRTAVIACFAFISLSEAACACEIDPFLFQLPGETLSEARKRSESVISDLGVVATYERQRHAFERAKLIYLARVVATERGGVRPGQGGRAANVTPLQAIKGLLPTQRRMLARENQPGACTDYGDGLGALSSSGELVLVFEGLPISRERRRGIDSFPASAIRFVPLLDAMRKHGKDLED